MTSAEIQQRCHQSINGLRECIALDGNHARDHLYRCAASALAAVIEFLAPPIVIILPPLSDRPAPDDRVLAKVLEIANRQLLPLRGGDQGSTTRTACYTAAIEALTAAWQHFLTPDDVTQ